MRAHEFVDKLHKLMAKDGMGGRPITFEGIEIIDIKWDTEAEEFVIEGVTEAHD